MSFESEFHLVNKQGNMFAPVDDSPAHSQEGYNLYHSLISDYIVALKSMNVIPIKAHVEGGRSQLEIDIVYEEGLRAANNIVYFKDAIKAVTRQHRLLASFMPKIGHDWWGHGMHLHVSLCDSKGNNLFNAEDKSDKRELGLSEICYHFIGGLLRHMEGLCAIASPTVNSYRRILLGRWNADAIMYGAGARGAPVRIPDERGRVTRIECRFPDASCNPYLAMACIIAVGLDGIEREIESGEPANVDISYMTDREISAKGLRLMPRSLYEALSKFENDDLFRKILGDTLVEEYIRGKEFEIAQASDKVTQWEIEHFLDLF